MTPQPSRRSLVLGTAATAGLAVGHRLQAHAVAQGVAQKGYVLGPSEGEHLIQRGGNIFIKADPTKGSNSLAMERNRSWPA